MPVDLSGTIPRLFIGQFNSMDETLIESRRVNVVYGKVKVNNLKPKR
jgi:hypothetical protein